MPRIHLLGVRRDAAIHELEALVGPHVLTALRATEPHPTLAVYRVAHEGESTGTVLGVGATVKRWGRQVVDSITRRLHPALRTKEVPVYLGHALTNEGREAVGVIIGARTAVVDGDVVSDALVHLRAESVKAHVPDVCSIEADVELAYDTTRAADVLTVGDVTGLCVAYSADGATAGFPRAGLLEQIQCLATVQEVSAVTLKELRKAIEDGDISVNDILTLPAVQAQLDVAGRDDAKNRRELEDTRKRAEASVDEVRALKAELAKETAERAALAAKDAARTWRGDIAAKVKAIVKEDLKSPLDDAGMGIIQGWYSGYEPRGATDDERKTNLLADVKADLTKYESVHGRATPAAGGGIPPLTIPLPTGGGTGGGSFLSAAIQAEAQKLGVPLGHSKQP